MRYCKRCILSESHETIRFDEEVICNICRQEETKHIEIDWDERAMMLSDIIERYKGKGQDVEGISPIYDHEKIECIWQGIRDHCKCIKHRHGRTNHLACMDIRNGEMDRETGMELAKEYDGKHLASSDDFLKILDMPEKEFEDISLSNAITDWGFSHEGLDHGRPLSDMERWDKVI